MSCTKKILSTNKDVRLTLQRKQYNSSANLALHIFFQNEEIRFDKIIVKINIIQWCKAKIQQH